MSAEHEGQSPCPCRGCTTAYKAGYTAGYNEAMRLHQNLDVVDWVYGYNQHGKGENP